MLAPETFQIFIYGVYYTDLVYLGNLIPELDEGQVTIKEKS
jgi:hypothetical protein